MIFTKLNKSIFFLKIIIITAFLSKTAVFSNNYIETAIIDRDTLIMGTFDGHIILLDLLTSESIKFKAHDQIITSIAISLDGKKIASTSADGVKVWDRTCSMLLRFPLQANSISFSPKDDTLLISGFGLITLIDMQGNERRIPHTGTAKANFDHKGELISIVDFNEGQVLVYSLKTEKVIFSISEYWPRHAVFSLDDKKVVVSSWSGVNIYHLDNFDVQEFQHKNLFHQENWFLRSSVSSKDSQITSVDNNGCLIKIDLESKAVHEVSSRNTLKFSGFYDNDQKIVLVTDKAVMIYRSDNMHLTQNIAIF